MKPMHQILSTAAVLMTLAICPRSAEAQIWSRPKVAYPPASVPPYTEPNTSYSGTVPGALPITAYRFYGPTPATYTYQYIPTVGCRTDATGTYPVTVYKLAPVLDYSPGYYYGYDSARFFRN